MPEMIEVHREVIKRPPLRPLTVRLVIDPDPSICHDLPETASTIYCIGGFGHTPGPGAPARPTEATARDLGLRAAPERCRLTGRYVESDSWEDDPGRLIRRARAAGHVILPVWRYEHGMRVHAAVEGNPFRCPWDSGGAGFAFMHRDTMLDEIGHGAETREKAERLIAAEVDSMSAIEEGDVFAWIVEDDDGETLDSCWGYIRDKEYPIQEARETARWIQCERSKLRQRALSNLIRNGVPIGRRRELLTERVKGVA